MESKEVYPTGAQRQTQDGRGRFDLISPIAMRRIAARCELGVQKYAAHNEKKGMPMSRFVDSSLRHIYQYLEGDRSEDHLAAAAWNLMSLMHTEKSILDGNIPSELNDLFEHKKIEKKHFCSATPKGGGHCTYPAIGTRDYKWYCLYHIGYIDAKS